MLISEVLGSSLRTRESIRYGESEGKTFHEIIDAATIYGWHSFDHCLLKAFETNEINEETAQLYCNDKGRMRRDLDLAKKRIGRFDLDPISTLKMEVVKPIVIKPISGLVETELTLQPGGAEQAADQVSNRRVINPRIPAK